MSYFLSITSLSLRKDFGGHNFDPSTIIIDRMTTTYYSMNISFIVKSSSLSFFFCWCSEFQTLDLFVLIIYNQIRFFSFFFSLTDIIAAADVRILFIKINYLSNIYRTDLNDDDDDHQSFFETKIWIRFVIYVCFFFSAIFFNQPTNQPTCRSIWIKIQPEIWQSIIEHIFLSRKVIKKKNYH